MLSFNASFVVNLNKLVIWDAISIAWRNSNELPLTRLIIFNSFYIISFVFQAYNDDKFGVAIVIKEKSNMVSYMYRIMLFTLSYRDMMQKYPEYGPQAGHCAL